MADDDDIAVIGIACRFPGADDIDEFWNVLKNGEDHVKIIPRWDADSIEIKNFDDDWKPYAKWSGLVKDADKWDNKFFGISDTEAGWMDPQQCMALEVTYSALEDGGLTTEKIKGTNTGVYVGCMNRDLILAYNEKPATEYNNFVVTGLASSIISNRISYHFDFRGPSITVDTACSSALVSIHLGCQAIKTGECDMAICGGVNSLLTPVNYIALRNAQMISKTGKSQTFSADADGYARGEGCGMVILKRFKQAMEDGDKIWGIVMSGCNQDGKTNSPITAPSGRQQKSLLSSMYSKFDITPSLIQYIEAHGTGTPVGDPTEANALGEFFARNGTTNMKKIPIGSVKSNIGHLESAAGTAGLIKVLLMMKNHKLVPSLHYSEQNSHKDIDFTQLPLTVCTEVREWQSHPNGTRLSCVNSFGFGGTNSHLIVRQVGHDKSTTTEMSDFLVTISAKSQKSLLYTTEYFLQKINSKTYNIQDLSYTSLVRREHFKYRASFVTKTMPQLEDQVRNKLNSHEGFGVLDTRERHLIFLFCGVGTVWRGMCRSLLKTSKVFKSIVIDIDKELGRFSTISMLDTLTNQPDNLISDSLLGPIAIFTCQVGLFRMWTEMGVVPNAIIGQSVGEVAAAHAAGCLTLPEAVRVTYYRSYLSSLSEPGRMLVVGHCDIDKLEDICKSYNGKLNIAVYSSDETCVVSGDQFAVEQLKKDLESNSEFQSSLLKDLNVNCGYHSYLMEEASRKLVNEIDNLDLKSPKIKVFSTSTGKDIIGSEMCSAHYWSNNLLKPVLLKQAVKLSVVPEKKNLIVEIGPRPILRAHLKKITEVDAEIIPSCNAPDETNTFMKAVASLYAQRISFKVKKAAPSSGQLVDIPRYKFARTGNLLISDTVKSTLQIKGSENTIHPFISQKPMSVDFKVVLSVENTPYIYEHVLDHKHIVPGSLHAEIGLFVAKTISGLPLSEITVGLHFVKPLFVGKRQTVVLDVEVAKQTSSFEIKRKEETLCKGKYSLSKSRKLVEARVPELKQLCQIPVSKQMFYDTLYNLGFEYGPSLQIIGESWRSETDYLAELNVPDELVDDMYSFNMHPAILDGVLQTLSISWIASIELFEHLQENLSRPIPVRLKALTITKIPAKKMYVYGRLLPSTVEQAYLDILLLSEQGEVIADIESYEVKNVAPGLGTSPLTDMSYGLRWTPLELSRSDDKNFEDCDYSLFVCLSSHAYEMSKMYFKYDSCVRVILETAFGMDVEVMNCVDTILKISSTIPLSKIRKVIYFPGHCYFAEDLDTEEVYHSIKTSSLILLKLLQTFMEKGIDIPVWILTERTQLNEVGVEQYYNIVGAELWGMCRCLVREQTYSNLRLVDITEGADLQLLPVIDKKSAEDDLWTFSPEFKISKETVYMNQILRFSLDETPSFRMNSYNKNQPLELRSMNYQDLTNLVFVPKSVNERTDSKHEVLQVETAVVNPVLTPITMTSAIDDPDPWKDNRCNGHPIIATEICGKLERLRTENEDKQSRWRQFQNSNFNADIPYVTCFPCCISNMVSVPTDCLIPKHLFRDYDPGMMHECIWYLGLKDKLQTTIPIRILYNRADGFNLGLLGNIFRSFKLRIDFVCEVEEFKPTKSEKPFQLILLLRSMSSVLQVASQFNVVVTQIVTFSHLLSKPMERNLRHVCKDISISVVNNDEILSRNKLAVLVKQLKSWLSKQRKNQGTVVPVQMSPKRVIQFNDDMKSTGNIRSGVLPVKVDKRHIFHKSAGYMIVGGLSGLGWETVEFIAQLGGGCIATVSRSPPTDERLRQIDSISEKYRCKIITLQADVSNIVSLKGAFDKYQSECKSFPLKGIFNGAAIVDDALIVYMTEEKFERVLRTKVKGTLNLHTLSQSMKLDYFILHSSITSAFGNSGQTNYGAGNAFMDTFAFYRRSLGLSGQTINWGALHLGLLEKSQNVEKQLNSQGYQSLKRDDILRCMLHTLTNNFPQIIYGIFQWDKIVRQSPDMIQLASKIQPLMIEMNLLDVFTANRGSKISVDIEGLQKLPEDKRLEKIKEVIALIASDIFAVELETIQTTTSFAYLGIESMKAMGLINTIYEHFNCKIPVVSVLDQDANIEVIANLIVQQISAPSDLTKTINTMKTVNVESGFKSELKELNDVEQYFYAFHQNEKSYSFIQVHFTVADAITDEVGLQNAFNTLHTLHPEFHSVYIEKEGIPYRIESTENMMKKNRSFCRINIDHDDIRLQADDTVIHDGRVLKVVYQKREDGCIGITMFFDRMLFDITSSKAIFAEFTDILTGKMVTKQVQTRENNSDHILNEIIAQYKQDGRTFWSSMVSRDISPIDLYSKHQLDMINSDGIQTMRMILSRATRANLKQFCEAGDLTIIEYFLGAYQLILHLFSDSRMIAVSSFVNLKHFVSNIDGPMENLVPFIAFFEDGRKSCVEFLYENAANIRRILKSGNIPFIDVITMFVNTADTGNTFKHGVFEDVYFMKDSHYKSKTIDIASIKSFDSRLDTALYVSEDLASEQTIITLCHNHNVNKISADKLFKGLLMLTDNILQLSGVTLEQMKMLMNATEKEHSSYSEVPDCQRQGNEDNVIANGHSENDNRARYPLNNNSDYQLKEKDPIDRQSSNTNKQLNV